MKLSRLAALFRRLNRKIHETFEDLFSMAPYRIRLIVGNYSPEAGVKQSDFDHHEMLIHQWLFSDRLHLGKEHSEYGRHLIMLADLYADNYWPARGLKYYEKAHALYKKCFESDEPRLLDLKRKIADCHGKSGHFDLSEPFFAEIAQARLNGNCSKDEKAKAIYQWKGCLLEQNKLEQAIEVVLKLLSFIETDECLNGDMAIEVYTELASLYARIGDDKQSQIFSQLASRLDILRIIEQACGRDAFMAKVDLEKLRDLFLQRGKIAIASRFETRIDLIVLNKKVSQGQYPGIERDLLAIARCLEKLNEPGDSTIAHRVRRRAQCLIEKRRLAMFDR
ncbi:MAG: hypothetical protein K8F91_11335 [Candidatus Obscuribacterales bacterium]|nr:hypothetical protein [Candidatus Obscuribacterales bacterium]